MLFLRAVIVGVFVTAALSFSALANSPPVAAPRTPVTVQELPPASAPEAPTAEPHPTPEPRVFAEPVEKPLWRQPFLYALIALADTLAASITTVLYLKRPSPGMIRLAAGLTASSALFIAAAVAAWLL